MARTTEETHTTTPPENKKTLDNNTITSVTFETNSTSIDDNDVESARDDAICCSGVSSAGEKNDVENANYDDISCGGGSSAGVMSLSELDPPPSHLEKLRDKWMSFLGGRVHFWIGVIVMLLIIADGAFFFFLLIGAQRMCRPRTDCEPRNWWYNFSIQFLNVLFTYLATISLPWRISNTTHLFTSKRDCNTGHDLYGRPTEEIWYHISQRKRRGIVILLILNSLTQYANQVTRIVYYSYELQAVAPGSIWTNVFFFASMLCAAVAGFTQLHEELRLRKEHPERFPPGLVDATKEFLSAVLCRKKSDLGEEDDEDILNGLGGQEQRMSMVVRAGHATRDATMRYYRRIQKLLKNVKTSLDLWGL